MSALGHSEPGFVGRHDELAQLRAALDSAYKGRAVFAAVLGPTGIGKSRLANESLRPDGGLVVLRGGCIDIAGMQSPYGPFTEAVRRIPRTVDAEVRARAQRWLQPGAGGPAHPLDPAEERRAEFLRLLGELAEDGPVVLFLEDLQWADRSSLELLVFLARNLTAEKVLVIAVARTGDPRQSEHWPPVLEHLRRLPDSRCVEPGALPAEDIARIALDCGAPQEQLPEIVRLAEGYPQAAKQIAERCAAGERALVPDGTRALVDSGLRRLPRLAREAVGAAAVAGTEVDVRLLAELLHNPFGPDLDAALDQAVEHRLLVAEAGSYRFRHALERQAVYDGLPPEVRRRLHRLVAERMEAAAGAAASSIAAETLAQIAAHWMQTDDAARAAAASIQAGMAAYAVSAWPEALAHLETGRRLWRTLSADPVGWQDRWLEVTRTAAECARWDGKLAVGLSMLEGALEAATGNDRALLLDRIGYFRRELGDWYAAREAYLRGLDMPPGELDDPTRARLHADHALLLMTGYRLGEARVECAAALEAAGPESVVRCHTLITLGVVEFLEDRAVERGLALLEEARALATRLGNEEAVWRYVGNTTFVLQNIDRIPEAIDLALEHLGRARRTAVHRSAAVLPTVINAVSAMVLVGRWAEALELVTEALTGDPAPGQAASLYLAAAEIHTLSGDRQAAQLALARARVGAERANEPELTGHICRIEATEAVWRADFPRARAAVDEGLAAVPPEDPDTQLQLAAIGLRAEADAAALPRTRDPERVRHLQRVAEAAAARPPATGRRTEAAATLALVCQAEADRSRGTDKAETWQQVAAGWDRLGCPYPAAYARLRQAERVIRRPAAAQPLEAAAQAATELGAALLLQAVKLAAQRLRVTLPDTGADRTPAPPRPRAITEFRLTNREAEVLAVLATGADNASIARALGISTRTVTTHLSNLYPKLEVTDRAHAITAVHRLRLLDPPDD